MLTVKLADEVYELLDWEPPHAKPAASVTSPTGTLMNEPSGAGAVGDRVEGAAIETTEATGCMVRDTDLVAFVI
jgi:hypothetical protein